MRTRTLITGAAFLLVGVAGAQQAQAQVLSLKGSDTLELVSTDVIAACPGATGNIVYVGGGSGAGQAAMAAGTQHVAPMSRQLNGTTQCNATSRQLLIGLDGITIVAKNESHGAPDTCTDNVSDPAAPLTLNNVPSQFIPCTSNTVCNTLFGTTCDTVHQYCQVGGTLAGCTSDQGCNPAGTYTFDNGNGAGGDDWKDVLAQIYGGQNHNSATATLVTDAAEANADGTPICFASAGGAARNCKRNPLRIDCSNPVRGVLLSTYQSIINAPTCTSATPECVKLRHAFRRDDLSGTTDAFQALVGLVPIAPFTTQRSTVGAANAPEIADFAAVASPFCNAGLSALNKGFSDGLDLDPYRRSCATGPAPDRFGLESACQAFSAPTNSDVGCYVANTGPAQYQTDHSRDRSAPQGRGVLAGGSVDTLAALQNDYLVNTNSRPRCLGVVQPVSIPQDVSGSTTWAQFRYPQGGNCTPGVRAFVNPLPARTMMCPDGSQKAASGTCRLPQNTTNGRFDCVVDSPLPAGSGISDARVFNLGPVNSTGNMAPLTDSYANPNFPPATMGGAQPTRRFARRYFGLHMVRPDNLSAPPTIATGCTLEDDTSQIGCLVKASPCSFGYAGREAADNAAPFNNVALRMAGIQVTQANIENLATGGTPVYPMARKLWFNSFLAGTDIGFTSPPLSAAELALSNCMGLGGSTGIVDTAIAAHNFVVVPASVPRLVLNAMGGGCPLP